MSARKGAKTGINRSSGASEDISRSSQLSRKSNVSKMYDRNRLPRRKGVERRSPSPKTTKGTSLRNSTELRSSIDNSGETGQQHQDRLEELRLENERIIRETERLQSHFMESLQSLETFQNSFVEWTAAQKEVMSSSYRASEAEKKRAGLEVVKAIENARIGEIGGDATLGQIPEVHAAEMSPQSHQSRGGVSDQHSHNSNPSTNHPADPSENRGQPPSSLFPPAHRPDRSASSRHSSRGHSSSSSTSPNAMAMEEDEDDTEYLAASNHAAHHQPPQPGYAAQLDFIPPYELLVPPSLSHSAKKKDSPSHHHNHGHGHSYSHSHSHTNFKPPKSSGSAVSHRSGNQREEFGSPQGLVPQAMEHVHSPQKSEQGALDSHTTPPDRGPPPQKDHSEPVMATRSASHGSNHWMDHGGDDGDDGDDGVVIIEEGTAMHAVPRSPHSQSDHVISAQKEKSHPFDLTEEEAAAAAAAEEEEEERMEEEWIISPASESQSHRSPTQMLPSPHRMPRPHAHAQDTHAGGIEVAEAVGIAEDGDRDDGNTVESEGMPVRHLSQTPERAPRQNRGELHAGSAAKEMGMEKEKEMGVKLKPFVQAILSTEEWQLLQTVRAQQRQSYPASVAAPLEGGIAAASGGRGRGDQERRNIPAIMQPNSNSNSNSSASPSPLRHSAPSMARMQPPHPSVAPAPPMPQPSTLPPSASPSNPLEDHHSDLHIFTQPESGPLQQQQEQQQQQTKYLWQVLEYLADEMKSLKASQSQLIQSMTLQSQSVMAPDHSSRHLKEEETYEEEEDEDVEALDDVEDEHNRLVDEVVLVPVATQNHLSEVESLRQSMDSEVAQMNGGEARLNISGSTSLQLDDQYYDDSLFDLLDHLDELSVLSGIQEEPWEHGSTATSIPSQRIPSKQAMQYFRSTTRIKR